MYQSKYPILIWQFIVFGHNEHEIPLARTLARQFNMEFQLKFSWDKYFSPVRNHELVRKHLGLHAATRQQFNEYYGVDYMQEICHQLWDQPQINWDGGVLGCCRNLWGDFGGNALTDGLLCSLNNTRIEYAREMLLGKREARADIPCTTCAIYLGMKENHRWLKRGLSWWCARAAGTAFRFYRRNVSRDSFRMISPSQGGRGEGEHPRETLGKKGSGL